MCMLMYLIMISIIVLRSGVIIFSRFPLMVDGQNVDCTVKRYFADTHKVVLKYPNLSCLHVGPKDKHIFIPMEVCIGLYIYIN